VNLKFKIVAVFMIVSVINGAESAIVVIIIYLTIFVVGVVIVRALKVN
jgi:hypothetical protein